MEDCAGRLGNEQRQENIYFSLVSPLDRSPDPKYKPHFQLKNHHVLLFVIHVEAAQNSLELFLPRGERKWLTLRHSSGRVPHKDQQPQRRIRKVRRSTIKRKRSITNEEKQTRSRPKVGVRLMLHQKADTRVGGGEHTHTAQIALLFLHTLSLVAFTAIFARQDFSICFQPTVVQFCALCRRRTDILGTLRLVTVLLRIATAALGKERSLCVHTTSPHCALQTLRGFPVTEDIHLSQVTGPGTRTTSMNRKDLQRETVKPRRFLREDMSRRPMSSSLPALPPVPCISFMSFWKSRIRRLCK